MFSSSFLVAMFIIHVWNVYRTRISFNLTMMILNFEQFKFEISYSLVFLPHISIFRKLFFASCNS